MDKPDRPKSSRRRDIVVATLVAAAMIAVGLAGYSSLVNREEPPPPDPATAAARFAQGWIDGDVEAIEEVLVRRPGEDLVEALAAFDPLEPTDLRVVVGDVALGDEDGFATVTILPELDVPEVGTWAWTSQLQMERGRGSWRIRWDHTSFHPALADGLHFETRVGAASRAPILAFDGTPLTSTGEVVTIGIEPSRVPSAERLGESLASLVPEAVEPLEKVFARADLVPTWFYPLVTVPAERLAGIRERVTSLPGIIIRATDGRVGASAGFGRHLLGRVGPANEDQARTLGVEAGTEVGIGGLEEDFDEQLRGSEVVEIVAVERDGDVRASVATFSDDLAESVLTTLDALVQEAIENALVGQQANIAVVAVGTDGGVLGAASRPLTGYNRAFEGSFAPGAAVWGLTVASALDQGNNAETVLGCPAETTVGGVRVENLAGFDLGEVTLEEAVGNGCRTSIATLAGNLPQGTLFEMAGAVGFNNGIEGLPTPQWPQARDTAERGASGIGQAQLLSSPAHLASIAAAFVDGSWNAPRLLPVEADADETGSPLPFTPGAVAEATAIFESAGSRAALGSGVGLVAGEGSSSEGNLGWASVMVRSPESLGEFGLVVLVERGTRADAIAIVNRLLAELRTLRDE